MTTRRIFERTEDNGKRAELYEKDGGSPEIFIDGAWGATIGSDAVFKLNLYTRSFTAEEGVERREIAARLAMSVVTLSQLADYLNLRVKDMIRQGLIIESAADLSKAKSKPTKTRSKKSKPTKRQRQKTKSK